MSEYLSDIRKIFNQNFILTDEVFQIANTVLGEKAYDPMNEPEDFEVQWTGKLAMSEITAAKQLFFKNASDINLRVMMGPFSMPKCAGAMVNVEAISASI